MNCKGARERFIDRLHQGPDAELSEHLAECAPCRRDMEGVEESARALQAIPEIDVDRMPFSLARRQTAAEGSRSSRLHRVPRLTMAAGIAAAVLVGIVLWTGGAPEPIVAYVAEAGADSPVPPESPIHASVEYRFPSYAEIVLPAVGTLRVRPGTAIRFESATTVQVEDGEVFLEIHRRPRGGFHVRTERFVASVRGTRFGVRPYAVYVLSGSVNVQVGPERVESIAAGETISVGHDRTVVKGAGTSEMAAWILRVDPPTLVLTTPTLEAPLRVDRKRTVLLRFGNPSRLAPMMLPPVEPRAEYLHLSVQRDDGQGAFQVALNEVKIIRAKVDARLMQVDADSPIEIEATVSPDMFPDAAGTGIRKVRFVYTCGGDGEPRVWKGSVQTEELLIEVVK